jgi:hypothetical protein
MGAMTPGDDSRSQATSGPSLPMKLLRSPGIWVGGLWGLICLIPIAVIAHMFLRIGITDSCYSVNWALCAAYSDLKDTRPDATIFELLTKTADGRYVYRNQTRFPITITDHGDMWTIAVEYDPWYMEKCHAVREMPKDFREKTDSATPAAPAPITVPMAGTVGSPLR